MKFKAFLTVIISFTIVISSVLLASQNGMDNLILLCAAVAMPESAAKNISSSLEGLSVGEVKEAKATKAATSVANELESLTVVPEDIQKMIDEAKIDFADQKKDGTIVESTYTNDTATAKYGLVGIRNTTQTAKINVEKTLNEEIDLQIDRTKPAVLIVHTHTTEGYEILDRDFYAENYVSRTTDKSKNVARVGLSIKEALESKGFQVIHDTTVHDSTYNGSYERSAVTIKKYLEKYPNIEVILDVHRDAIQTDDGTKIKPVNEINSKKSAQIMIITGCEEQGIENYPDWYENLKFTLKVQNFCEKNFKGLMRPILFSARKYNMNLSKCSILVEVGSDANTLDEAVYAGKLFGLSLGDMLKEYVR